MQVENEKLKQYLLGNLPAAETETLDMRVIIETDFEESLILAEAELIEDYLENALTDAERQLFYENFLISEERKYLLEETTLLKKFARRATAAADVAEEKKPPSFLQALRNFFAANLRPVTAVLGILIIGLLALGAWRIFMSSSLSPIEKEYAALNEKNLSEPAEISNLSKIVLFPGTFRSGGAAAKAKAENLSDSIFFQLALPAEIDSNAKFKAELLKDERKIFTLEKARIYQNGSGKEVRLLLPKSLLTKGQYQINLENTADNNAKISYGFTVE